MLRYVLAILLIGSFAFAQAPQSAPAAPAAKPAPPAKPAPAAAAVAPAAAVITIDVPCATKPAEPAAPAATCKKTVSRAEFDRLVSAIAPDIPAPMRRQLAQQYAQILAVASRASAKGLDKDPKVQVLYQFARMNVLAKFYVQQLQKQAENVPDSEVESYYSANKDKFERAKLQRLYIPKPFQKDATPEQLKAVEDLAAKLHDRAAAGEDLDKLEQEAFDQVKALSKLSDDEKKNYTAPKVDIGEVRRGRLPEAHESKVFALNAGQVSPVIAESTGYFVYKVVSKDQIPLAEARDEIRQSLGRQRFQQQIQEIESAAKPVFNEAYFGAAPDKAKSPSPKQEEQEPEQQ